MATGTPTKSSIAIAARLREQIVRGDLRHDDPLPVEAELVTRLGSSKAVVREALRILETEGLVEVRRGIGGGPRVRHPEVAVAARAVGVHLQLGDVDVVDVVSARDGMIANAIGRLTNREPAPDLSSLDERIDELERRIGDVEASYPALIELTEEIVRLGGNATEYLLVTALRQIVAAELTTLHRRIGDRGDPVPLQRDLVASWRRIVRHVRAGRDTAAVRVYREQSRFIRETLRRGLGSHTVIDLYPRDDPAGRGELEMTAHFDGDCPKPRRGEATWLS